MIAKAIILIVILASGETRTYGPYPGPIQCGRAAEAQRVNGAMAFCVDPSPSTGQVAY